MDPGLIVVVVLGVMIVAAALGVSLLLIVLRGIRGEDAQWPVTPDARRDPYTAGGELDAGRTPGTGAGAPAGGHPEWTGRELAGDDLRPVGTHEEKHALPGRARWW